MSLHRIYRWDLVRVGHSARWMLVLFGRRVKRVTRKVDRWP